jgi:hypothetical protein
MEPTARVRASSSFSAPRSTASPPHRRRLPGDAARWTAPGEKAKAGTPSERKDRSRETKEAPAPADRNQTGTNQTSEEEAAADAAAEITAESADVVFEEPSREVEEDEGGGSRCLA